MGSGARLEVDKSGLGPFATPQPHASLLHVAKLTAAKLKADKTVPRLQPVAGALSDAVHAQLGASWVEDSKTLNCMACTAPFTNLVRRHHCRMLGIVVCDACSSRRAVLPGQGTSGVRVCDAALSIVKHLSHLASKYDHHEGVALTEQAARKARMADEAARVEAARTELLQAGQAAREVAGGGTASARARASSRAVVGGSSSASMGGKAVSGAASAANEAMMALHERGDKLDLLGDKVDKLGQESEDFFDMARKMRMKAEKQSKWSPF